MRISIAAEAGRPDRVSEDWAGAGGGVCVVLDGLTEGPESGCVHGTPWYVHQLGGRLLTLAGGADRTLADALGAAIGEVASAHAGTCALDHPGSPGSTVTAVRWRGEEVEYLALGDSLVVLDVPDGPVVVTDTSAERVPTGVPPVTRTGDDDALAAQILARQRQRNRPGGYWIAQATPAAAGYAVTGTATGVRGALLLTDGAARAVTDFAALDWSQCLEVAYRRGPADLIALTRELERQDPDGQVWPRYKRHDDATALLAVPGGPGGRGGPGGVRGGRASGR